MVNESVNIIANPAGYCKNIEIHTTRPSRSYRTTEQNDSKTRTNGQYIYFKGCLSGTAVVEIRSSTNNALVKICRIPTR